jgi:D-3-phosphoglycerate dehydrogenase
MNNVAVDYAIEKGLYVISTPNSYARATAELVFAHFFLWQDFYTILIE